MAFAQPTYRESMRDIDVAAIHDVDDACFGDQQIESVNVVHARRHIGLPPDSRASVPTVPLRRPVNPCGLTSPATWRCWQRSAGPDAGPPAARDGAIAGKSCRRRVGIETADMLVQEVLSRNLRDTIMLASEY